MTATVERLASQVKALPEREWDEFLSWLCDYETQQSDAWDSQLIMDTQPKGRLASLISRARRDIASGRTKPLDEILNDA